MCACVCISEASEGGNIVFWFIMLSPMHCLKSPGQRGASSEILVTFEKDPWKHKALDVAGAQKTGSLRTGRVDSICSILTSVRDVWTFRSKGFANRWYICGHHAAQLEIFNQATKALKRFKAQGRWPASSAYLALLFAVLVICNGSFASLRMQDAFDGDLCALGRFSVPQSCANREQWFLSLPI